MENSVYIINTLFMLFAMVLIIFMVPGFAMLEAGIVRTKNVVTVLSVNVIIYLIASFAYLLVGFNIMFGGDGFLLQGIKNPDYSIYAMFMFQMAFVGKTVNIMSGAISERARIIPIIGFAVIMAGFIYPLVGHAIWGGGMLSDMHDLAGSTVIHSTGAWAALAAILVIGPRKGRYTKKGIKVIPASNIPLVTLGTFLLWIGWFGFNGGSQLAFGSVADADVVSKIILNTNTAGLTGGITAMILVYAMYKKFDITMVLNGALGGLVAITAGADVMGLWEPMVIGAIGGAIVVFGVPFFDKLKIDDPVGALSVHLLNGIWGTLAVAIFADFSFWTQLKGVLAVGVFAFLVSYIIIFIGNKLIPVRSDEESEYEGLDLQECGMEAYPEFKK